MLKQEPKLKIIFVLIIAYFLTAMLSKSVFITNTPKINKVFLASLKDLPITVVSRSTSLIASIFRSKNTIDFKKYESLPVTALKPMAQGVYAGEENGDVVYIRVTKDVEFEEREINYEGKKIKVRFPKGSFK